MFDLIPLVGATIAAVLVGIVTVFVGFPATTIAWVIWSIFYQQIENNLIQPRIQSPAVDVQPFIVLVAVLFGSTLFGVLGALLAVPLAATIQIIIREILRYRREQPPAKAAPEPASKTRLRIADCQPQPCADRHNGLSQARCGPDDASEFHELMLVRQHVVNGQHPARRQHTNEVAHVSGVGRALGIEEHELPLAFAALAKQTPGVPHAELDEIPPPRPPAGCPPQASYDRGRHRR